MTLLYHGNKAAEQAADEAFWSLESLLSGQLDDTFHPEDLMVLKAVGRHQSTGATFKDVMDKVHPRMSVRNIVETLDGLLGGGFLRRIGGPTKYRWYWNEG